MRKTLAAIALTALAVTGCGSSGDDAEAGSKDGPSVVAASTWEAAFARAAGATDVTVIVPAGVAHPPDYDPKPSDIAKVARADFVLYAPFEGFAGKLKEAAGSKAKLIEVKLDNSPAMVKGEVNRLAAAFGTAPAARTWTSSFDTAYAGLKKQVGDAYAGGGRPAFVSQAFVAWTADLLGAAPAGTYGPQPPTPSQVAGLAAKKPALILDNSAMAGADALASIKAERVTIVNFPGKDLDLIAMYRANAGLLTTALKS
ncbi:metal ABC transporter solute-binding protein, Zn/Mn family [Spirillospora sp. CA-294931]|uniref:metal ABC transporter solute-binding protein, Zn/Mn family n=1 Tax=Spirillospora sp. CA-294931 TaxID=3240042 RepID=UPI003D8D94C8